MIAPARIEEIIEYPIDTPSNFTKNKSNAIKSEFRFANIKKNKTSTDNKMK